VPLKAENKDQNGYKDERGHSALELRIMGMRYALQRPRKAAMLIGSRST
jgi:hypothetical protein